MGTCWVHENASLQGILNHRHSFTSNIPHDVLNLSDLMMLRFLHVWVGGLWLLKLETGVLSAENEFCSLLKRGSRKFMFNCSCRHMSISSHISRKGLSAVIITYCRTSMFCSMNTISYLIHSYLSPLLWHIIEADCICSCKVSTRIKLFWQLLDKFWMLSISPSPQE